MLRASEVYWVTHRLREGQQQQQSFYCKGRKYQSEWAEVKCFRCLNRSSARLTSFKKGGVTLTVLFLEVSLPLGCVVISSQHSKCQKRKHFIFLFCFYIGEQARPPCTGTKGGITKANPEKKELCGDLPAVQRFTVIPFPWSHTELSEQLICGTWDISSPTVMWKLFLWWSKVKCVGLCHTLCSVKGYTPLYGKQVPSGCLPCLFCITVSLALFSMKSAW